ncbi:MAG: YHS domain-containing (seleno)protein [Pseudomonadota bacterium]
MSEMKSLFSLSLILFFMGSVAVAKMPKPFTDDGKFIGGYDPVSYIKVNKAVKGSKQFQSNYQGVTVHFSSQENKQAFDKDPAKWVPAYGGYCAYAMARSGDLVDIDPKSFKVVDGKTYLFYNGFWADTLKKWNAEKKKDGQVDDRGQIQKADALWKKKHQ